MKKRENSNRFLLLFYSHPRIAIALMLVLINLLVIALFTLLLTLVRGTNFFDELAYCFIFTMCSDGIYDFAEDKDVACLIIKIVLVVIQMIIFSGALIGFTTDVLSNTFDKRLENRGKLRLKNHYVILNWSSIGPNIVYELSFLEGEHTIVILSEHEREEVINSIDNIFTLNNKKKKGVRIYVKKGDPNSLKHLSDISISKAKCVGILLTGEENTLEEDKGISSNDLNSFKLLMSIINISKDCNIVMETENNDSVNKIEKLLQLTNPDIAHRIALFSHNSIIGHILGRAVTNPIFSFLFDEMLGFDGVEFYNFEPMDISEALHKYSDCIPVINYDNYLSSKEENKKQLYVISDEASKLGERNKPLKNIVPIKYKEDIRKEEFSLYMLSDGNRHQFVEEEILSYNKMFNVNVTFKTFSYKDNNEELIRCLENDKTPKKLLFLSANSEDLSNQDADIFVSLMDLKLKTNALDNCEIYCEVVNPNNLRSLKNLGVASIIVSNKIISLFMIQLLTHKSSRKFYRDILVMNSQEEEDLLDFDIINANQLIDMEEEVVFDTYAQFVQSFYEASNKKYMVIGRKKVNDPIDKLEFFCTDMDKHINLTINKDDQLILIKYY